MTDGGSRSIVRFFLNAIVNRLEVTDLMPSTLTVGVCNERTFEAALGWLYRELPTETRSAEVDAARRELAPENLVVIARGDEFLGALVAECSAGRVGWIGEVSLLNSAASDIARPLIRFASSRLAAAGARLVQALLPPEDGLAPVFEASGFFEPTRILRMNSGSDTPFVSNRAAPALEWLAFSQDTRAEFERIVQLTYRHSLDIPELEGLRPIQEVIEGYRSAGSFRADLWQLSRRHGESVGCVLLLPWPQQSCCELQYMGVVPDARGQGLGRALCVRAIENARNSGAPDVFLWVDERNVPATRLYESLGFQETERRRLFLRKLTTLDAVDTF